MLKTDVLSSRLWCFVHRAHRQRRFSIVLRALGFWEWEMSIGFDLKLTAALSLNKRVSLYFEVMKPGTNLSSLAVKVQDGIFSWYKVVLSTQKVCCLATSMNYLSYVFWITQCSFCINTCSFTSYFYFMEMASLLKPHEPTSASFQVFLMQFLTSLSLRRIEES